MAGFEDFTNAGKARVVDLDPDGETAGHKITIGGVPGNVTITCDGGHLFPGPITYVEKIQGPGFDITLDRSKNQIIYKSTPAVTGSWTATDPGQGQGGGHGHRHEDE